METTKKMIPVWFWVGLMMVVYGILIVGIGVYYLVSPPQGYAAKWTNPNLWWGLIMLVVGGVFMFLGRNKKESN
ncbi:MAG: hypothetical protein N2746_11520 [Deltaproteobacteria bacterium]|nr:hypothetical protein [Deltaproteobacteria bacterium]